MFRPLTRELAAECLVTFVLIACGVTFGVFAIGDARNGAVPGWFGPVLVGVLMMGVGIAFGGAVYDACITRLRPAADAP